MRVIKLTPVSIDEQGIQTEFDIVWYNSDHIMSIRKDRGTTLIQTVTGQFNVKETTKTIIQDMNAQK